MIQLKGNFLSISRYLHIVVWLSPLKKVNGYLAN